MIWGWAWLAATAAERGFLVSPFEGAHSPSGLFDHGSQETDRQLAFTGQIVFGKRGHAGYDFVMDEGTPIFAAADGVVLAAGDHGPTRCWGTTRIEHSILVRLLHEGALDGRDYVTIYMHLSGVSVAEGDRVHAGQQIGLSGNTGCSHGPHLHFQVNQVTDPATHDGFAVDPYGWQGRGPDPKQAMGKLASAWLWQERREPPLQRTGRRGVQKGLLAITEIVGTDFLEPRGERVRIRLDSAAPGPVSLDGYSLENANDGIAVLPDRTLAPGETLDIWIERHRRPGPGEITLGRSAPLLDDREDCVHLVDPAGRIQAFVPYGRATAPQVCHRTVRKETDGLDPDDD